MRRSVRALAFAATALSVMATGAAAQSSGSGSAVERALESRTKGNADAAVVIFEIADFQCPYCARFAQTVAPELDQRYVASGKVQWVFVNLPLHTHPLAWHAAEAALCAGVAGNKFWAMHDRLYQQQQTWTSLPDPASKFAEFARDLGVPMERYEACVADDEVASLILQDVGSAVSARIDGTPTFIVMKDNTVVQRLTGVQPIETWAKVLDEALK